MTHLIPTISQSFVLVIGSKGSPPNPRPRASHAAAHTHPAPPAPLVDAVRSRYPYWADLSVESARAARQHPLPWLLKQIEDIYDARYAHDVCELEAMAGADEDELDDGFVRARPFPEFVKNWCGRTYGVKALAEKAAWEVMCNAEAARSAGSHASVDVFCAFCNRGYDDEELLFFLYCRRTVLMECAKRVKPAKSGPNDVGRRFVLAVTTVSKTYALTLDEQSAGHVTRLVFGNGDGGRGMLYQAVVQLIGEYFSERRAAIRENRARVVSEKARMKKQPFSRGPPTNQVPDEATMDVYYYLKLMLSAYRDTRPNRDGSEIGEDEAASKLAELSVAYDDPLGFNDADASFKEHAGAYEDDDNEDPDPDEDVLYEQQQSARRDRARREEAVFASRDISVVPNRGAEAGDAGSSPGKSGASRLSLGSRGSPVKSSGSAPARAPPSPEPPLDPRGASVRLVRRAITDSCSKYCDVLLQVAQDLPEDTLAELKRKAVLSLDGRSQALFSGALAAAFGSDLGGGGSPGADAAVKVAGREPDVVAAVAKSVTALLRQTRNLGDSSASQKTGGGEAREIARVVLASRTIRSHVEPMLATLLSELDEGEDGDDFYEEEGDGYSEQGVLQERDEEDGEEVSTGA